MKNGCPHPGCTLPKDHEPEQHFGFGGTACDCHTRQKEDS